MPFNVYNIRGDGRQGCVFYIVLNTITKKGEVESTGWTHSFDSDQKDGNQYTARLLSTLRSYPIGHAIATIEGADLPKFHEYALQQLAQCRSKSIQAPRAFTS
ncbi:hypothetical protein PENNAL_c0022G06815 [Penicillium nalgiovense]|uniref:Uncharacterized protein n=1 Tax=Penicillium nalgiovense TaxID=60175 RepID=A0A1V6YFG8_PENNA|nr:hypothetical protein PENNAL_c0022G06815 [Penicillium nalgiovense]